MILLNYIRNNIIELELHFFRFQLYIILYLIKFNKTTTNLYKTMTNIICILLLLFISIDMHSELT